MGGCQNYGPFLGTLNIRCRTIIGTQKGTIILTTTHRGSELCCCPASFGKSFKISNLKADSCQHGNCFTKQV